MIIATCDQNLIGSYSYSNQVTKYHSGMTCALSEGGLLRQMHYLLWRQTVNSDFDYSSSYIYIHIFGL